MRPESQTSFPESVTSRKSCNQLALLCSPHWIPNSNLSFSAEEQITADMWEHPREKWGWRGERGEHFSNTAFLAFNQVQLHSIHRRWSLDSINKIFNEANYPKSFPNSVWDHRQAALEPCAPESTVVQPGPCLGQSGGKHRVPFTAQTLSSDRGQCHWHFSEDYTFPRTYWDSVLWSNLFPKLVAVPLHGFSQRQSIRFVEFICADFKFTLISLRLA